MSKIMIVDDEIEYTEMLSETLQSLGYNVTKFNDPNLAFENLQVDSSFDLILSDIKMPQMLGTDFFKKYKTLADRTSKFVLMTGHADCLGAEKAYALGVDELLAKPFDREVLGLVVDYLLERENEDSSNSSIFFQIPIQDFMISSHVDCYLYLKINEKFVCVSKTGQEFTAQRLHHFVRKGVTSLYLKADDYAKYTDLQFAIADSVKLRPIENAKKTKIFRHLLSTVSKNAILNSLDKVTLHKSLTAFESYTQMMFSNTQLADMITGLTTDCPDVAEQCALVAVLSSGLAEMWQWTSPKTVSRIIMGAMLCDIGLKNNPELSNKKKIEYTREELKLYENHPYAGYKMLSDLGGIPEEVLQITLQHHENGIGSGFPQKTSRQKIHSYAKLIHGVHEFVEILMTQKNKNNIHEALDHLFNFQRKIVSEQVIKSLYKLFSYPLPKDLETLMLPDKAGRLI